jgi:hypothetical protein
MFIFIMASTRIYAKARIIRVITKNLRVPVIDIFMDGSTLRTKRLQSKHMNTMLGMVQRKSNNFDSKSTANAQNGIIKRTNEQKEAAFICTHSFCSHSKI